MTESISSNQNLINNLMNEALIEANKAKNLGEVPVGAIITDKNFNIVSRGHNLIEAENDPTAHAEIVALKNACKKINNWRLNDYKLIVTLEPCIMCSSALILSRISEVYFGCKDLRMGGAGTIINICNNELLPTTVKTYGGYLENESRKLIQSFFKELRK